MRVWSREVGVDMSEREVTPEEFTEFTKKVTKEDLRRYRETEVGLMPHQERQEDRDDMQRMIDFLTSAIERRERCGEA
jgi:hypothetical protein